MRLLGVIMLWVMHKIEWRNIPHEVWYQVVHRFDSESSDHEESHPETTDTIVPPPNPGPLSMIAVSPPPTATMTLSIPPAIEEHLTHLKEGHVRIEGLL